MRRDRTIDAPNRETRRLVGTRFPREGQRTIARVLATGHSARVSDYGELRSTDAVSAAVVPEGYGSGIAAPIRAAARLWGGLLVIRLAGADPFTEADERRLEGFAELIGLAITNSETERRLRALAATDPLTGLAKHRAFQEGWPRRSPGAACANPARAPPRRAGSRPRRSR